MHKFIVPLMVLVLAVPLGVQAGVPEAVTYLKTQTQDEWITQALVAAGEQTVDKTQLQTFSGSSITDYAKKILAIVAVGENPRTFAGVDLVQGLKDLASSDQLGDTQYLNDDAWGVIALSAAAVVASDPVVSGARDYLLAHQGADGGWSYDIAGSSDTNDTAAVLMALADVGVSSSDPAVTSALSYLHTQQGADGGFAYQVPCAWPGCEASDSASTSWVVSALAKMGQVPDSWTVGANTPLTFLSSLQLPDGSFKWQAGDLAGSSGMTAYATVALAGHWYPVPGLPPVPEPSADLTLTQSVSASAPHEGDQVTYNLVVTNTGPDQATSVVVTDNLPAGVTYVSDDGAGTYNTSTGLWAVGPLASAATTTLHITATVNSGTANSTITNAASAQATQADPVTGNNSAGASFTVAAAGSAGGSSGGGGFVCTNPDPVTLGSSIASHTGSAVTLNLTYPSTITEIAFSTQADFANARFEPATLTHALTVSASDVAIYVRFRTANGCATDTRVALGQEPRSTTETPLSLLTTPLAEHAPAVLGASDIGCQLAPSVLAASARFGFVLVNLGVSSELWYLDPVTRTASCAEGEAQVLPLLRKYALGITNKNLKQIAAAGTAGTPSPLAKRLAGRILLQVEGYGEAWYVDPVTGTRTYLPPTAQGFAQVRTLAPLIAKP